MLTLHKKKQDNRPKDFWLLVVALLAITACNAAVASRTPGQAAVSPSHAATASLSQDELLKAVQFRISVGLRADEAWILQVAADPSSRAGEIAYGVPLTPDERAELDASRASYEEVVPKLTRYGQAHSDEWAGVYEESGIVVAQFTGNVEQHAAAIALLVPTDAVRVKGVRWSLAELTDLSDRIALGKRWLGTVGATLISGGVDVRANAVTLRISTGNDQAPDLIADYFDADREQIHFTLAEPPWSGPTGVLVITAINASGDPVPDLMCVPIPAEPGAYSSDAAWSTLSDGRCLIPGVGATDYVIELRAFDGVENWVDVGRGNVTVHGGEEAAVTIVVKSTPSP